MGAVSIRLTPASREAWIAAMTSFSSFPPQPSPPMAQVPNPMIEALRPELPMSRICMREFSMIQAKGASPIGRAFA
jgi:hypothetical protein